ncbi:uncharacterized protein FIBRA_02387 [Fibroporia radiculosa]|uniref:ubiquitinyl hydrolase 1 n=1 Tax=Fibroporia radiculosa TaxID=599839 RepID=J4HUU7_9APHY|nr:uncharacterized protein FIBRA_02387 [Fibroporia radiculosa]CCM00357.1 predicted protein [Fibroporia radiculosa]
MSSEPSSSSPKRAASDEPFQDPSRAVKSQQSSVPFTADRIPNGDIDAYMAEQEGSDGEATLSSPTKRLATVEELSKAPMRVNETWYVVSPSWYKRWRKALSGEVDKEGPVKEADIGPVDNSDIVSSTDANDINQNVAPDDLVYVPQQVWEWFTRWYGQPHQSLPRKVVARGVQAELSLELHPLKIRMHILSADTASQPETPPRYATVSSVASVTDLVTTLATSMSDLAATSSWRAWKLADDSRPLDSLYCTSTQLKERGATLVDPSTRSVEDALIQSGDSFVYEEESLTSWVVDANTVSAQPVAASASTSEPITTNSTPPKVFGSDGDFFSQMQAKLTSPAKTSLAAPSALKPSVTIKPTSATSSRYKASSLEPGTLGLGNMGNTCFMNSALQCLAHTKELMDYFLTGVFEEELNPDNPLGMQGAIAQAFGALLQRIWATGSSSTSYSPREFKQALQRFAPQFSGYQQHDSQELVAFLLDGLHEDLNRVLKKPYVEKPDWEGGGDKELVGLANESWQGYMRRNDSVIVDLFQGQYQSTLVCPECEKVSITFDPFMYLTLPLPIQKKWKHAIYYVPWSLAKPHVKIPVEINRDASFKDLRQLLGRWMDADPDCLLTMETFSSRFYKDLDDTCLVGEMNDNDIIVCFELPCHAQQSRTYKQSPDDPVIIAVNLCDIPARQAYRSQNLFGYPFVIVLDQEQAADPDAVYEAIIDRLQRWTDNARDLFTWEATTPDSLKPVRIPLSGSAVVNSITEIKENGDVVTVQEPTIEEGDITDEKATVVQESDEVPMEIDADEEVRKVGVKKDIFKLRIQACDAKYGIGYGSYGTSIQRFDLWEFYASQTKDLPDGSSAPVLRENSILLAEFDENMKAYYFGDGDGRWDSARWDRWQAFEHPEYIASRQAAASMKNKGISLQDCLDEFTREEQLGADDLWYCPRCKKHQQAMKRFDLWKVPDVLVVHLKRFSNSRTLRDKIDTFVDFPINGLDISPMVGERQVAQRLVEQGVDIAQLGLSDIDEPLIYDLYAVDEHLGGLGGGHYRAYAYNDTTDKWYHFDDSYVSPVQPEAAVNANAYLLFYKRRTSRPLGGKSHAMVEAARTKATVSSTSTQPVDPPAQTVLTPPTTESNNSVAPQLASLAGLRSFTDDWPTQSQLSPASSPPPLDDGEPPSFENAQFDSVLQTSLDPLAISTHRFDYPSSSSRDSPTSSIEALPDMDDAENAEQHIELDETQVSSFEQTLRRAGFESSVARRSSPSSWSLDGPPTYSDDDQDEIESVGAVRSGTPLSDIDV